MWWAGSRAFLAAFARRFTASQRQPHSPAVRRARCADLLVRARFGMPSFCAGVMGALDGGRPARLRMICGCRWGPQCGMGCSRQPDRAGQARGFRPARPGRAQLSARSRVDLTARPERSADQRGIGRRHRSDGHGSWASDAGRRTAAPLRPPDRRLGGAPDAPIRAAFVRPVRRRSALRILCHLRHFGDGSPRGRVSLPG
jgi:hypothetical protein